ncbi:MAG TPA: dienelactone hydrolase family protein [Solirubrobacterales bacterium]|nr:dienelactone hydrolase family protein [Solirubrobacterales bacterium]
MCFDFDSRPPELPADLIRPPISGGAAAEQFTINLADGTEFAAALAQATERDRTAVVIIPDVRGLHPFYVELAERFAQAGHHAIAFDYYGRTAGPGPRDDDFDYGPHREQVKLDSALEDIAAAAAELRRRTGVAAVATVGFCFGGSLSFVAGTRPGLGLARVVGFYGVLDASRFDGHGVLTQAERTSLPLLGLFGGADQAIPQEQVDEFESQLGSAGVEHEIHVYPGAPHSFFDKKQDEFTEESEDAWRRILSFLGGHRAP